MKNQSLTILLACLLLSACVTNVTRDLWALQPVTDTSKLNISYKSWNSDIRRTVSKFNQTREGWVEEGMWKKEEGEADVTVWIFVASLFTRVFTTEGIVDLRRMVNQYSGNGYVELGEQGVIKSGTGPVDYIFYRNSGQACVFVRAYWSDPELEGDKDLLPDAHDWMAGTSFIYTYYCRSEGGDLSLSQMNAFLDGIDLRNVYWPDDKFVNSGQGW